MDFPVNNSFYSVLHVMLKGRVTVTSYFPVVTSGLKFVIDQIISIPNSVLMMRYSEWALSKDQTLGVRIFTASGAAKSAIDPGFGAKDDDTFKPSIVVKRLHNRWNVDAYWIFLFTFGPIA